MARRDERNRNNRAKIQTKTTRTRIIDGDQRTKQVLGALNKRTGTFMVKGYGDHGNYARRTYNENFETLEGGNSATLNSDGPRADVQFTLNGRTRPGRYLNVELGNPDKRVSETVYSSRMQALDSPYGDDDTQKQRQLKTKREGRSKLRIQASGDSSAGRLKGGPNTGRQRNKLSIGVQGADGVGSGLNVPR